MQSAEVEESEAWARQLSDLSMSDNQEKKARWMAVRYAGVVTRVPVEAGWTAWELREALAAKVGEPPSRLRLLLGAAELPDDALLPDSLLLHPEPALRLARSHRLAAGADPNTQPAKPKKKAKSKRVWKEIAKSKEAPKPAQKAKHAKQASKRQQEKEWLETELAKFAPRAGEDELYGRGVGGVKDMRQLLHTSRRLLSAYDKLAAVAKGSSEEDKTIFRGNLALGRACFTEEAHLLKRYTRLGNKGHARLQTVQHVGRSILNSLASRHILFVADETRITLDDETEADLVHFFIGQRILKNWRGEEQRYSVAEAAKAHECAVAFVEKHAKDPLSLAKLADLYPSSAVEPLDKVRRTLDPNLDEEAAEESDAPMDGAEEEEAAGVAAAASREATIAERREDSRKDFVRKALHFINDQFRGQSMSVEKVEARLKELMEQHRGKETLTENAESGAVELRCEGKPGPRLFAKGQRSTDATGALLPVPLHNPGTLCFLAPPLHLLSQLVSPDTLTKPDKITRFVKVNDMAEKLELDAKALVVSALRVHLAAAHSSEVASTNLYVLALSLCALAPTTFGDPVALECDASEALTHLLSLLHSTAGPDFVPTLYNTKKTFRCPGPSPGAPSCDANPQDQHGQHAVYIVKLAELVSREELARKTPQKLVELLERSATKTNDWDQGCKCSEEERYMEDGVAKKRAVRSGKTTDSVVSLPPVLIVKLERALAGHGAGAAMTDVRVLLGTRELDLTRAVDRTPSPSPLPDSPSPTPLLYTPRAIILKTGWAAGGHYVYLKAAGPNLILANDSTVMEVPGSLDQWATAFAGVQELEGYFEDMVVLETLERGKGELGRSVAAAPTHASLPAPSSSAASTTSLAATSSSTAPQPPPARPPYIYATDLFQTEFAKDCESESRTRTTSKDCESESEDEDDLNQFNLNQFDLNRRALTGDDSEDEIEEGDYKREGYDQIEKLEGRDPSRYYLIKLACTPRPDGAQDTDEEARPEDAMDEGAADGEEPGEGDEEPTSDDRPAPLLPRPDPPSD